MTNGPARPPRLRKDGVDTGELAIDGKRRMRLRKPSPNAWTRTKERLFLSVLSETCNVKIAAAEAGVSAQRAYERRRTHARFRAAWVEAVGVAYAKLELILLDRALNGVERIIKRSNGSEERMVEYSNQVALTLFKMHRDTAREADHEQADEDVGELREKLLKRLIRLRERAQEAGEKEQPDE